MGATIDAKTCQSLLKAVTLGDCITGGELFGSCKTELIYRNRIIERYKHPSYPFMVTEAGDVLYVIEGSCGEAILRKLAIFGVLDCMPFGLAKIKHGAGRAVITLPDFYQIPKTAINRFQAAEFGSILTTITNIKGREERDKPVRDKFEEKYGVKL